MGHHKRDVMWMHREALQGLFIFMLSGVQCIIYQSFITEKIPWAAVVRNWGGFLKLQKIKTILICRNYLNLKEIHLIRKLIKSKKIYAFLFYKLTKIRGLSRARMKGSRLDTWLAIKTFFLLSEGGLPWIDIGRPVTASIALRISLNQEVK